MANGTFLEIVRRLGASRSDNEAWKMLTDALWPTLLATSYRILRGNLGLAEEAVQESFLRLLLYARFEDFDDKADALRSYALVICKNVSRSYLRQLLQSPEVPAGSNIQEQAARSVSDTTPESVTLSSEIQARLVVKLDQRSRELVDLMLLGYSVQEISERLGLTYGNTAVRIHRLRALIAKWLKKQHK